MTAQVGEKLILDGEPMMMTSCPDLPHGHPGITQVSREEASAVNSMVFSTACWRNYIGTWEIKNDLLYLNSIEGVFKLNGNEPLFAEWVSETLMIPRGKMLQYVHMGFESIYEETLLIKIEKGHVIERTVLDNRKRGQDGIASFINQIG